MASQWRLRTVELVGERRLLAGQVVPNVSLLGDDFQGDLLAATANQDRYLAGWFRLADDVLYLHILAVVGDFVLVSPHAFQQVHGLRELLEAGAGGEEGHAEVGEFAWHPAAAKPGNDATAGDVVSGSDDLAELCGVAHAGGCNEGADLDTVGDRGNG